MFYIQTIKKLLENCMTIERIKKTLNKERAARQFNGSISKETFFNLESEYELDEVEEIGGNYLYLTKNENKTKQLTAYASLSHDRTPKRSLQTNFNLRKRPLDNAEVYDRVLRRTILQSHDR